MKKAIQQYFNGNFLPFYGHYLPDLKRVGKEHKATCRFHDDTDPSLSINAETGKFHCFGCEAGGDIFTFNAKLHGLSLNGDFPKVCQGIIDEFNIPIVPKKKSNTKKKPNGKQGRIVQTYDYREDMFNELLFQKVRTEPKGFYIRRRGIDGEWKNGLGKVKPILYRQKQVIEAEEVCIAEGEKDVDNLAKLGFTATTNFDGASKWRPEYNEPLVGKSINIFPDNDEQGRKHAQLVASRVHPVAKSVKIIELPDLEDGEDVSDFIAKSTDAESVAGRLSIIIENTPHYEPPRVYTIEDAILTADKFMEIETPEKQYFLKPWCKDDSIILMTGHRGVGKTFAAQGVVNAVTSGSSFGSWKCERSAPCLYLDGEMTVSDNKERIKLLGLHTQRKNPLYYYSDAYANRLGLHRAHLNDEEWRSKMQGLLLKLGIKLWVIDNLASLSPGLDENAKQDWDEVNQWLLDLRFAGICTIMLHHTNKQGGQRGTSAREDNLDISILLKPPFDYSPEEGARFIFHFSKARIPNKHLGLIADTEFKLLQDKSGNYEWSYRDVKKQNKQEVLKMFGEGYSQKNIVELTGLSKGYVSKIKKWAIDEGYLTQKGKLTIPGKAHLSGLSDDEK